VPTVDKSLVNKVEAIVFYLIILKAVEIHSVIAGIFVSISTYRESISLQENVF